MSVTTQEFQGMSDDDLANERSAKRIEREAYRKLEEVMGLLRDAAQLSELMRDELNDRREALNNVVADYSISHERWTDAIRQAREREI